MAFLEDLVRYAKLNLPGNKKVAEIYSFNEQQKQLEELRSQGDYPNLESYIEESKNEGISQYNPIEQTKAKIKTKFLKSVAGFLHKVTGIEEYRKVDESMQEFENALNKAHKSASLGLSQYKELVSNIKKVSKEDSKDYKTVIENPEYLDKALRKAMPDKEEAERLQNKRLELYKESIERFYNAKSILEESGLEDDGRYNITRNLPKKEEIQVLFNSYKSYADKEVDRVYS